MGPPVHFYAEAQGHCARDPESLSMKTGVKPVRTEKRMISFTLPQVAVLEAEADRLGISVSDLTRRVIDLWRQGAPFIPPVQPEPQAPAPPVRARGRRAASTQTV